MVGQLNLKFNDYTRINTDFEIIIFINAIRCLYVCKTIIKAGQSDAECW